MNERLFTSDIFDVKTISLAGTKENIALGGKKYFSKLPKAFKNVRQIGVIGWSSQGPAQAQNLRDSLMGTDISVKVGLREGSSSVQGAIESGFTPENGTLGEMYEVIRSSNLVLLLISDAGAVETYKDVFKAMKPGSTLGLSHGFLVGYLESQGEAFPGHINIVGVCPKGMGPAVRRLYVQGKEIDGAGINCSFAVHQDVTGNAKEIALGWSVGIGAPYTFFTTLDAEWKSDIYGERGVLVGAVHGIVEALYRYHLRQNGDDKEQAFLDSAKSITLPLTKAISKHGLKAIYKQLDEDEQGPFKLAYSRAYTPAKEILAEIYDEVASGNEILSVISATTRQKEFPLKDIGTTEMWQVGAKLKANTEPRIHPVTAGVYIATMVAQADILREKGYAYSEIVNESIIEAIDSLNPYIDYKGIAFMVDNCSMTAKLGARKWAPRFDYILSQQALSKLDDPLTVNDNVIFENFLNNPLHDALGVGLQHRPSVDISLYG